MKSPSMTTSTISNPLLNFAKRAFPPNYQPKKKMPSDEIHNFWNSNPKSSGSKNDEALRATLELPKAKLGRIKLGCISKICNNTSLNGYGSGGIGKLRLAAKRVPRTRKGQTFSIFCHEWCQNAVALQRRWFQIASYQKRSEKKLSRTCAL